MPFGASLRRARADNSMICGLGVGVDLERWGYAKEDIAESDWSDTVDLSDGFTAYIRTARHFSGRNLHRS